MIYCSSKKKVIWLSEKLSEEGYPVSSIHGDITQVDRDKIMKNFRKDHRVFMMSCIAALTLGGKWKIYDKDSINSSFPKFIKILKKLGAKIN